MFILFCFVSVIIILAVHELPKYRTEHGTFHGTTTTTATTTATAAAAAATASAATSSDQQPSEILVSFVLKLNLYLIQTAALLDSFLEII